MLQSWHSSGTLQVWRLRLRFLSAALQLLCFCVFRQVSFVMCLSSCVFRQVSFIMFVFVSLSICLSVCLSFQHPFFHLLPYDNNNRPPRGKCRVVLLTCAGTIIRGQSVVCCAGAVVRILCRLSPSTVGDAKIRATTIH